MSWWEAVLMHLRYGTWIPVKYGEWCVVRYWLCIPIEGEEGFFRSRREAEGIAALNNDSRGL